MAEKNQPRALGLPLDIKVSDMQIGNQPTQRTEQRPLSARERLNLQQQDKVRSALHRESPKSSSELSLDEDSWAEMPVDKIRCYEYNPRKHTNESYQEMKESIRVNGVLQTISITKRPGEQHYITFSGGNTRLQIVQELYAETGDVRFSKLNVIIKKWRGESAVLLAHMAENTQRNDMTFWDKANGTLKIKEQLEQDLNKQLSHREFEQELKSAGIGINLQAISSYRFAIGRLSIIGDYLSKNSVRDIQPQINSLLKLNSIISVENSSEDDFFIKVVDPVSTEYKQEIEASKDLDEADELTFKAPDFIHRLQKKLAQELNHSYADIKKMLTMLDRFKDQEMTKERLLAIIQDKQEKAPQVTPSVPVAANSDNQLSVPVTKPQQSVPVAESIKTDRATAHTAFDTDSTPDEKTETAWGEPDETEPSNAVLVTESDNVPKQQGIEPSDAIKQLKKLVGQLISVAEISNCVVEAPDMPLGYYVGFDQEEPFDLIYDNPRNPQAAWWISAMASKQFDRDACRKKLPANDPWRALVLDELTEDTHTLGQLELELDRCIGLSSNTFEISWLLDSDNKIAQLGLEILMLLRQLGFKRESLTW